MTRNLKTLGLALVAMLALGAVMASGASAASASFTPNVGAGEQAEIRGEQVGTNTFTVNGQNLTCVTSSATGFPEENGTHKVGPLAPSLTLAPTFDTCHVKIGVLTRTATVTLNSCTNTVTATKNTGGLNFSADLTINCSGSNKIEIHVYNTSNHNDTGASTLCTYDITHQTLNGNPIELTNTDHPPAPDDVLAHIINTSVQVHNTIKSATCGQNSIETGVYSGTYTIQAIALPSFVIVGLTVI